MHGHDIVVIGASAGGVESISQLVALLPESLPATLFVVMHVPDTGTSVLPQILSRRGKLPAVHPADGQSFKHGMIYVAPPGHHMRLRDGRIAISRTARENGHRPAIDPLFRSAAHEFGHRVVGIILSGTLDDGSAGMVTVGQCGGITIAQDPNEALFPGMPQSAIANDNVDMILPIAEIAKKIIELANDPVETGDTSTQFGCAADPEAEAPALHYFDREAGDDRDYFGGTPSVYTCPECHGTLWETEDENVLRFRCRVGHAYTAESLVADQLSALESTLWAALRALEENAALYYRLADRAVKGNRKHASTSFKEQANQISEQAKTLRSILLHGKVSFTMEQQAT